MVYRQVFSDPEGALPARKTTDSQKAQSRRFIEAAREAEASEDEAVFRENLKRIAKAEPSKDDKSRR